MALTQHPQWISINDHTYQLKQELDQRTVPSLWHALKRWQPGQKQVEVDLSGVSRVDSAGMALLIHLIEHAKNKNCHIMLSFVPTQLHTLLQLSNCQLLVADHIQN